MSLKDKVANYLFSFLDKELVEWKPTRDDPHGRGLVAAATAKNTETSSAYPRTRVAKAELKAAGAAAAKAPLIHINPDTPLAKLGDTRPAAVIPASHAVTPEVKSVVPTAIAKKADTSASTPSIWDTNRGGLKQPFHTGGLANPHPTKSVSPEMQKKFTKASDSHVRAQADKQVAGQRAQTKGAADLVASREAQVKLASKVADKGNITKPEGGEKTHQQRRHLTRKMWKRTLAASPKPPSEIYKSGNAPQGEKTGRVDKAVTTALIAATHDSNKKRVLGLQSRPFNNEKEPIFVTPNTSEAPKEAPKTIQKEKKFVSKEVLADLKAKAAKK
jgi:hypothetical protein